MEKVRIDRFGFEDSGLEFYTYLDAELTEDIINHIKKYNKGNITRSIFDDYVRKNTCQYCLEFGHICSFDEYPITCPNLPSDFYDKVNQFENEFSLNIETIIRLALQMVGKEIPSNNPHFIIWNWDMMRIYLISCYGGCQGETLIKSKL